MAPAATDAPPHQPPHAAPTLAFVFSHSSHDSLIDKKNSLALPAPILPLTRLHALFIGVFKSHIGRAWIVRRFEAAAAVCVCVSVCVGGCYQSLCRESLYSLDPQPLGFYACVPDCESECTLSQVDRAFIYSTLKVCRRLAVIAVTVSASVCLSLPSPLPLSFPLRVPSFSLRC